MSEPRTVFPVGTADRGKRLDLFLKERIPGLSRSRLQRAIRTRVALSWGVVPRPATSVRPGGEVRVGYTPLPETLLELPIGILARGEGWLAVDKPPGIPVHPVNAVRENSLIRMLRRQEGRDGLRLVHRLDRETSGVLLVAETSAAASTLARGFASGQVEKEYLALVHGCLAQDTGSVALPIGRAISSRVFVRRETCDGGQTALTAWRVERRFEDRTLLRVFPRTGRRHQIRVHLAAIGHPVMGDILYGGPDRDYLDMVRGARDRRHDGTGPRRQLLHCARLVFREPARRAPTEVVAPLPDDFLAAIGVKSWPRNSSSVDGDSNIAGPDEFLGQDLTPQA